MSLLHEQVKLLGKGDEDRAVFAEVNIKVVFCWFVLLAEFLVQNCWDFERLHDTIHYPIEFLIPGVESGDDADTKMMMRFFGVARKCICQNMLNDEVYRTNSVNDNEPIAPLLSVFAQSLCGVDVRLLESILDELIICFTSVLSLNGQQAPPSKEGAFFQIVSLGIFHVRDLTVYL